MIKNYWEITLRDYDIIEKTGNVSHLKLWWNVLPVGLFNKQIGELIKILSDKINENGGIESKKLDRAIWQWESLDKINEIRGNYQKIYVILKQQELNGLKKFYQKFTWRRLKLHKSSMLDIYYARILKLTGIEIKTIEDVEKVRKDLEFRTDKYNEHFAPKKDGSPNTDDKMYLMAYALGVFSKLNMSFTAKDVTVLEFIDAKNKALAMGKAEIKKK